MLMLMSHCGSLVAYAYAYVASEDQALHCAMGLPATRKPATEEDQGEDDKDSDWLIEQSIARQVAGGELHCATAIDSCCNCCKK